MSGPLYPPENYISEAEYFATLECSEIKYEWWNGLMWSKENPDGLPVAMAGANLPHNRLKNRIGSRLSQQLGEAMSGDMLVRVEATGFFAFPDVVVACEEARYEKHRGLDTLLDPVVIFEILSPSTANFDRGDKLAHYERLATLHDYVLVFPDRWRLEHYQKQPNGTWNHRVVTQGEDVLEFPAIACRLRVEEVYRRVPLGDAILRVPDNNAPNPTESEN